MVQLLRRNRGARNVLGRSGIQCGMAEWIDLGSAEELSLRPLQQVVVGRNRFAVTHDARGFGVMSGACNHTGGPLGEGRLDGEYVVCPWHNWKFHGKTGAGEPGYEEDCVPRYESKVEDGRLYVDVTSATKRMKKPHAPAPTRCQPSARGSASAEPETV